MRLTDEVAEFLEGGVSLTLGTRDAQRMPECTRLVGLRVDPGRARITCFAPVATSARAMQNLEDNGEAAVMASYPPTHRTLQVKGAVMSIRAARDDERDDVERWLAAFADALFLVGIPHHHTMRLGHWPCRAFEVRIRDVYVQTPGPGAGQPWTGGPLP